MNTAISLLMSFVALICMALCFVLAIRAKRQFGFLAPLGFVCTILLQRICGAALLFSSARLHGGRDQADIRQRVAKLSEDDLFFYLGVSGHGSGIWQLGAICFLLCGWLDLKTGKGAPAGKLRSGLIIAGCLLILLSAFYPYMITAQFL